MSKEGIFKHSFSIKNQIVTRNTENKCPDNNIYICLYTHVVQKEVTIMSLTDYYRLKFIVKSFVPNPYQSIS